MDGCTVTLAVVTRLYISSLIPPLSLSCLLACLAKGSFFSRKKITFAAYEYKFVMALGMASIESVKMQSRRGDRGGIDCIIGLCCAVLCCAVLCCAVLQFAGGMQGMLWSRASYNECPSLHIFMNECIQGLWEKYGANEWSLAKVIYALPRSLAPTLPLCLSLLLGRRADVSLCPPPR